MLEIVLHRIIVAIIVGMGVTLAAASIEPPKGPHKPGYSVNPLLAGGGGAVITFGFLMAKSRKTRRKKKIQPPESDDGGKLA